MDGFLSIVGQSFYEVCSNPVGNPASQTRVVHEERHLWGKNVQAYSSASSGTYISYPFQKGSGIISGKGAENYKGLGEWKSVIK